VTGDWSSYSIGSHDDDSPVEISLDESGIYSGPLSEGEQYADNGKGSWSMPSWTGGRFYANVDLDAAQVSFRKMQEPDAFYPIFYQSDVNVNTADYPLKRVSENIYEGIVEVPAELLGEGNVINLLFSDNSGNTYVNTDYVLTSKNGENLTVGRVERNSEINCTTGGYVFAVQDYKGARLKVSIDLMTGFVRFSNPDVVPVTPEEVELQFAPDTPETLVFGELTDITVTYPEGVLDEDENYVWLASDGGYIREVRQTRLPGKTVFTVRADVLGEYGIQVGSNIGSELGIEAIEYRFNIVAPDYVQNGGETITLNGRNLSGDYSTTLTRKEPGIYTGTVDLDGQTIFRIYVPTAEGEVVLGSGMIGGQDRWEFDDESFFVAYGDEVAAYHEFKLQNVTYAIANEEDKNWLFLGSRSVGESELTVDLNTMTARLSKPDFKAYIDIEQTEIKAFAGVEFSVTVKSNVGEDLFVGADNGMITFDNPEVASFVSIERWDEETFRYVFVAGDVDGETKIHISSPLLQENGLEAAFILTVQASVNPEDIQLSFAPDTPETLTLGKPVDITVTYPVGILSGNQVWLQNIDTFGGEENPGSMTWTICPGHVGEINIVCTSELHERFGIPGIEHTFNVVAPEFVRTAGDEIKVKGVNVGGEISTALKKTSDGVYSGVIPINGMTSFRLYIPTDNGEIILGNIVNVTGIPYDETVFIYANEGEETAWGRKYTLHDVTDYLPTHPQSCYLVTGTDDYVSMLTVDLNTMTASLKSADFNPYIMVEETDIKARPYNEFTVSIKTNVADDLYIGEQNGFIIVENPEVASFNWLERVDDENYRYHFNGQSYGTTTIRISSPLLREAGQEAVVNVTIGDFTTESITLSTSDVIVREGEYAYVSYKTEPFADAWIYAFYVSDENNVETLGVGNSRYLILGKSAGENVVEFHAGDNYNVSATLKVTVLPADAKVAEHIVYTELEPEQRTRLYLDEHQDGGEAAPAWSSSDESVAVVDADGRVTALKAGRAVITADCGAHQVMAGIHVKNSTDVDEVSESRVNVYSQGTAVTVVGTEEGDTVSVYAADGSLMTSRRSDGSALRFDLGVRGAFVVTAGSESFKVVL